MPWRQTNLTQRAAERDKKAKTEKELHSEMERERHRTRSIISMYIHAYTYM